jgi:hypothetical protein
MEARGGYAVRMQAFPEYVMQVRTDVRLLRLDKDRLTRAHQSQKDKAERLERQLKEQAQRIKELERENEQLKRERERSPTRPRSALKSRSLIMATSSIPQRKPRRPKAGNQGTPIPTVSTISLRLPPRRAAFLLRSVAPVGTTLLG